ncbi:Gfo/Idh/MocA family protein [Fictibacillus terranigra]|uniref:Gfo/Idh/MocA family oxidoreductase n=1 Tax=Fictibacillus terranigra TaxID=3058424 RepID=A0ABT8EDX7_9BACL|nr:Gfo/Idh/MocA family oxidoreductase [Fictibacillus sp. CENA-BCM004]MDN4076024.1 Gfo/Idh/MocA family oxidoreductase [Fictibacillus sp. CENA-BCM004]
MKKAKIGVIGTGSISDIYLSSPNTFLNYDITGVADLNIKRAEEQAVKHHIPFAGTVSDLLAKDEIDLIVNLTIPGAHADVSIKALQAGKHVYSEKPLATTYSEGLRVIEKALQQGLQVGVAPDTFLGAGLQTCRYLLDKGVIGEPIGASAFMLGKGPESWHPNPEFFYKQGAGPLFDLGPYYLTALVSLLGPVKKAVSMNQITVPEREITSQPFAGKKIKVEVPTYVSSLLQFGNGVNATFMTSFDVWNTKLPKIEIYGTEGTLILPDPNGFDGPVYYMNQETTGWQEASLISTLSGNCRGIGLADMISGIEEGRPYLCSGKLGLHVLELMEKIIESSDTERFVELNTQCEKPKPLANPHKLYQHLA